MGKTKGAYDAVRTMREIRDRLSYQMRDMSYEEERKFIKERLAKATAQRRRGSTTRS